MLETRGAVSLAAFFKSPADFLSNDGVLLAASTERFLEMSVKAAAAHIEGIAKILNAKIGLKAQGVDQVKESEGSWLKMAKAFLKISRWRVTVRSSAWRRAT